MKAKNNLIPIDTPHRNKNVIYSAMSSPYQEGKKVQNYLSPNFKSKIFFQDELKSLKRSISTDPYMRTIQKENVNLIANASQSTFRAPFATTFDSVMTQKPFFKESQLEDPPKEVRGREIEARERIARSVSEKYQKFCHFSESKSRMNQVESRLKLFQAADDIDKITKPKFFQDIPDSQAEENDETESKRPLVISSILKSKEPKKTFDEKNRYGLKCGEICDCCLNDKLASYKPKRKEKEVRISQKYQEILIKDAQDFEIEKNWYEPRKRANTNLLKPSWEHQIKEKSEMVKERKQEMEEIKFRPLIETEKRNEMDKNILECYKRIQRASLDNQIKQKKVRKAVEREIEANAIRNEAKEIFKPHYRANPLVDPMECHLKAWERNIERKIETKRFLAEEDKQYAKIAKDSENTITQNIQRKKAQARKREIAHKEEIRQSVLQKESRRINSKRDKLRAEIEYNNTLRNYEEETTKSLKNLESERNKRLMECIDFSSQMVKAKKMNKEKEKAEELTVATTIASVKHFRSDEKSMNCGNCKKSVKATYMNRI